MFDSLVGTCDKETIGIYELLVFLRLGRLRAGRGGACLRRVVLPALSKLIHPLWVYRVDPALVQVDQKDDICGESECAVREERERERG